MDPPTPVAAYGGAGAAVTALAFTHAAARADGAPPPPRGVLAGTATGGLLWIDSRGGRPCTVRLERHEDAVVAVDALDDVAVSGGLDGVVRSYRVSDGRPARTSSSVRAHVGPVRGAVLVAPAGPDAAAAPRLLTFTDGAAAKLWTLPPSPSPSPDAAAAAAAPPRPLFAASLLRGHTGWIQAAHAVAGGGGGAVAAATGGADGRVVFWSAAPGADPPRPAARLVVTTRGDGSHGVDAVAVRPGAPGGRAAVAAAGRALFLCDARAPSPARLAADAPARVTRLAWHPDGVRLAAGGGDGGVTLLDVRAPAATLVALVSPHGSASSVCLAWGGPDGCLATAGHDRRVQVWGALPAADPPPPPPSPPSPPPPPPPVAAWRPASTAGLDASLSALEGAIAGLASALGALDARAAAAEARARLGRRAPLLAMV